MENTASNKSTPNYAEALHTLVVFANYQRPMSYEQLSDVGAAQSTMAHLISEYNKLMDTTHDGSDIECT